MKGIRNGFEESLIWEWSNFAFWMFDYCIDRNIKSLAVSCVWEFPTLLKLFKDFFQLLVNFDCYALFPSSKFNNFLNLDIISYWILSYNAYDQVVEHSKQIRCSYWNSGYFSLTWFRLRWTAECGQFVTNLIRKMIKKKKGGGLISWISYRNGIPFNKNTDFQGGPYNAQSLNWLYCKTTYFC